jgi:hypothetical protein
MRSAQAENKRAIYVSCISKCAMVTWFFLAFRCMRNKRLQLGSQTQHWPTMPAQGLAAADRRPIWERPGNCERLSLEKGHYRSEDSDMTLVEASLRIEEAETLFKANAGHQVERWARPGRGGYDYTLASRSSFPRHNKRYRPTSSTLVFSGYGRAGSNY